ncbi:lactamase [Candidatus Roizmanbacteria bacterium CG22_combo_CG10-13_8_21_14_all_38_20]|uniref:Lactamase n=1 Tax=Candidatus Roizmanbacteria bacterium CG22_combo_CG10-13_8_21_14_all_38_20 TaxID=1974862 RepID=A0A2H0BUM4_9BACT|nr:MBL fold metallo-hydrolase [Candidatus Microgenomates bacterium]PIP61304.1 MAG: lactamase [Candidatus Roizmanbacteria bacterium CG22_combo_CG10-13_8_21_14_all_38_20]PJC30624.1 MAG: lactamase [Candidatus Roizmanbacteria bacterium CG_4_9_14_0_2_um_filter_38_17]
MVIHYLGHSSFRIKGQATSVVTDPFDPKSTGLAFPKVSADVLTVSHQHADHNYIEKVEGNPFIVEGPGEYEIKEVRVIGYPTFHDSSSGSERGQNIMFLITIDDISILHCGDLGHKLTDETLKSMDQVDILLIPTGGVFTIDAKVAAQVTSQLDPGIVIPMHYNRKGLDQNIYKELAGVEDFISQIGEKDVQPEDKLTITKSQMPEETQMVVLNG